MLFFEVQKDSDKKINWESSRVENYQGTTKWEFNSASFTSPQDVKRVKFLPCRIPKFIYEEMLVDGVFFYKLKDDIVFIVMDN